MIKNLKRIFREKLIPFTSWIPRYYILFKWAGIPKDAVVLDLGCGEGYVTVKLAERCKKIVGIDISIQDIQLANDKKSRSKFKHKINFLVGNVLKLPFPDAAFDLVVFIDCIPQIEQDQEALAEIARVLKSSGRLVITTPWRYPCASILFKEQNIIKNIVPRFMYREYLKNGIKWYEADNDLIKKCFNIYHQYDVKELEERATPLFKMSRYTYFLKKFGALTTDVTYGIKGLWTIRFIFFWLAVRLDYYFGKNIQGYSIIVEFIKVVILLLITTGAEDGLLFWYDFNELAALFAYC